MYNKKYFINKNVFLKIKDVPVGIKIYSSTLSDVLGSITVKYVDSETGLDIAPQVVHSDLSLGSHTFNAENIEGYDFKTTSIFSITITEEEPHKTLIIEYIRQVEIPDIEGQEINEVPYISTYYIKPIVEPNEEVTIDYYITDYYHSEYLKDDLSHTFKLTLRVEGKQDVIINNLKAGNHSVTLGSFSTEGEVKFSMLCTDQHGRNSHELFNYFLVKNKTAINEYIMTVADLTEYGISNDDDREERVYVKVDVMADGATNKLIDPIIEETANSATIPSGKYTCFIGTTEEDEDGSPKMQEAPARFWENTIVKYASNYDKDGVVTECIANRKGLQQFIDDKVEAGYNKITLLPGKYRIAYDLIEGVDDVGLWIPTECTLDLNGATIKLNQFTGSGGKMVCMSHTFDSHVINGTIEGDYFAHDYENSPNHSEWVMGISMDGQSDYSSFENLTIIDIAGYGVGNGLGVNRDGTKGYVRNGGCKIGDTFTLGDIDRATGEPIESSFRMTSDFVDIGERFVYIPSEDYRKVIYKPFAEVGYMMVSMYLKYQGMLGGNWNIIVHFYNADKEFIKSVDAFQYRKIGVPSDALFCKVTLLSTTKTSELEIQLFDVPTNSVMKNLHIENVRAVGQAPCAMNNMLFDGCTYTKNGQTLAFCAFDAEDGWDQMQDVTFRNLKFYNNYRNDFLTCAGHNFMIEDFKGGNIHLYGRTRGSVIRNSNIGNLSLEMGEEKDILRHGVYRIYDNTINSGDLAYNLAKNITGISALGGVFKDSILNHATHLPMFLYDCKIKIEQNTPFGVLNHINAYNTVFNYDNSYSGRYNVKFNFKREEDSYYFKDCNFNSKSCLDGSNGLFVANFTDCIFDDTCIKPNVMGRETEKIVFENCEFSYSDTNFIQFAPFIYSLGDNLNVEFNNCRITQKRRYR